MTWLGKAKGLANLGKTLVETWEIYINGRERSDTAERLNQLESELAELRELLADDPGEDIDENEPGAKEKPAPITKAGQTSCTICWGSGYWVHPHNGDQIPCKCPSITP